MVPPSPMPGSWHPALAPFGVTGGDVVVPVVPATAPFVPVAAPRRVPAGGGGVRAGRPCWLPALCWGLWGAVGARGLQLLVCSGCASSCARARGSSVPVPPPCCLLGRRDGDTGHRESAKGQTPFSSCPSVTGTEGGGGCPVPGCPCAAARGRWSGWKEILSHRSGDLIPVELSTRGTASSRSTAPPALPRPYPPPTHPPRRAGRPTTGGPHRVPAPQPTASGAPGTTGASAPRPATRAGSAASACARAPACRATPARARARR